MAEPVLCGGSETVATLAELAGKSSRKARVDQVSDGSAFGDSILLDCTAPHIS